MSAGIVLITHGQPAAQLPEIAESIFSQCMAPLAHVGSGINLPMLLRVLNYRRQSLQQLCDAASSGGQSGIQQGDNWQGEA